MGVASVAHPDEKFMARALAMARQAEQSGEVPVGAVLVNDGVVVAEAGNCPIATNDPTAHAEICVLRAASQALSNYRLAGATLYVTMEPCPMCAGAMIHARIARLVFGAADFRIGAAGTVFDIFGDPAVNHRVDVVGGVLESECRDQLQAFFKARRVSAD